MKKCILIGLLALACAALLNCSGGKSKSSGPDLVTLMLAEINSHRVGNELQYDGAIALVALAHAQWLDSQATQAYQSTGAGGTTPSQRLTNAGVSYLSATERGCWTDGSIQTAFNMMNSGGALTTGPYTHVGIAAHL
jgi:hypothetical protein